MFYFPEDKTARPLTSQRENLIVAPKGPRQDRLLLVRFVLFSNLRKADLPRMR